MKRLLHGAITGIAIGVIISLLFSTIFHIIHFIQSPLSQQWAIYTFNI